MRPGRLPPKISPSRRAGPPSAYSSICSCSPRPSLAVSVQGAIDPNVAPRAAALEREGERQMAIDLLGRYLATAPDDGRAWLQLGRFYLFDARDWHLHGHRGDPDGLLYLDFAATAFDQAVRLSVDSGVASASWPKWTAPSSVSKDSGLGRCPVRAVPGRICRPCRRSSSSSAPISSPPVRPAACSSPAVSSRRSRYGTAVWPRAPFDILPIRPDLYATDSLYRLRIAAMMGVDAVAAGAARARRGRGPPRGLPRPRAPMSLRPPCSPGCRSGWCG